MVSRAKALRPIFDDRNIAGDLLDRVHVRALAVERDRQNRFGARRDRSRQ